MAHLTFPAGTHDVDPYYIGESGTIIEGAGKDLTTLRLRWPVGGPGVGNKLNAFYGGADNCILRNFTLDLQYVENGSPTGIAVLGVVLAGENNLVENVRVRQTYGSTDNWLESWCVILAPWAHKDCYNNRIIGCEGEQFYGNYGCGFYVAPEPNQAGRYSHCYGETRNCLVTGTPWVAYSQNNGLMSNNRSVNCGFGFRVDTGIMKDLVIENNSFEGCSSHGFQIYHDGWKMPCWSTILDQPSENVTVRDNTFTIQKAPEGRSWGSRGFLLQSGGGDYGTSSGTPRLFNNLVLENNTLTFASEVHGDEAGVVLDSDCYRGFSESNTTCNRTHWWAHFHIEDHMKFSTGRYRVGCYGEPMALSFEGGWGRIIEGEGEEKTTIVIPVPNLPHGQTAHGIRALTNNILIKGFTLDLASEMGGGDTFPLNRCGIKLSGSHNAIESVTVLGAHSISSETWAFLMEPWGGGSNSINNRITNCTARQFSGNSTCGFYIAPLFHEVFEPCAGEISGCVCEDNPWVAFSQNSGMFRDNQSINCGYGFRVDSGTITDLTIQDNSFENCSAHGIDISHDGWKPPTLAQMVAQPTSSNIIIKSNIVSFAMLADKHPAVRIDGQMVSSPGRPAAPGLPLSPLGSHGIHLWNSPSMSEAALNTYEPEFAGSFAGGYTMREIRNVIVQDNTVLFKDRLASKEAAVYLDGPGYRSLVCQGNASNRSNIWLPTFKAGECVDNDNKPEAPVTIKVDGSSTPLSFAARQVKNYVYLDVVFAGKKPKRLIWI